MSLRLPIDAKELTQWYSLVGHAPGDLVTGMIQVRLLYTPYYHFRVQV